MPVEEVYDELKDLSHISGKKGMDPNEDVMCELDKMKCKQIKDACDKFDINKLKELAISSGGFINDFHRNMAWPILLQIRETENVTKLDPDDLTTSKDYGQVTVDVRRSLSRFPPGIEEPDRYLLMDELTEIIIKVLHKYPELHYYQGYHDVAITFLLVLGKDLGYAMIEKLSLSHLKEFMGPTMERTVFYLTYVYPILKRVKPELHKILLETKVGTLFCLSWLITWFAHSLTDYRKVVRLYDFFLASPPLMPMYFAAAIVVHKEEQILTCDIDMAMMHCVLSKIPTSLPFERIIQEANNLYKEHHPINMVEEVEIIIKKQKEEEESFRKRLKHIKDAERRKALMYNLCLSTVKPRSMSVTQWTLINIMRTFIVSAVAISLYNYFDMNDRLPWS